MEGPLADATQAGPAEKLDTCLSDGSTAPDGPAEKFDEACLSDLSTSDSIADDVSPKCEWSADRGHLQLIWCHEHCNKEHRRELRCELEAAAQGVGACLQCVKKAGKFDGSALGPSHLSYLLLTDWREVKPFIDFVLRECPERLPVLTVVLCTSAKQHTRVQQWAASLGGCAGPIYTLMEAESPKWLANEVLAALAWCSNTPPALCLERTLPPAAPKSEAQPEALAPPAPPAAQPLDLAWMAAEVAAGLPGPALDSVLGIWSLCGSEANVEWLLRAAAPDCYED
mmetsp:Transcript_146663/g.408612  ORF Transcript_146663/g.408612 Transcript_146663/m.408612 type:complete len:284 (+) Transcript_146663:72-923(+)